MKIQKNILDKWRKKDLKHINTKYNFLLKYNIKDISTQNTQIWKYNMQNTPLPDLVGNNWFCNGGGWVLLGVRHSHGASIGPDVKASRHSRGAPNDLLDV